MSTSSDDLLRDLDRHAYYAEKIGGIHGCYLQKAKVSLRYTNTATGKECQVDELVITGRSLSLFKQDFRLSLHCVEGEPNTTFFQEMLDTQRRYADAALVTLGEVLAKEVSMFTKISQFPHFDLDATYVAQRAANAELMPTLNGKIDLSSAMTLKNKIKSDFLQNMQNDHKKVHDITAGTESIMFKMEPVNGRVYAHLSVDISNDMTLNKGQIAVVGSLPESIISSLTGRRVGDIVTCPPHVASRIIDQAFHEDVTTDGQPVVRFKLKPLGISFLDVMEMSKEDILDKLADLLEIESDMALNNYRK